MKPRKRCERCGSTTCVTKHHIIPKRHGTDGRTIRLCRTPCHDLIEVIISERENRSGVRVRLPDSEYRRIAADFVAV